MIIISDSDLQQIGEGTHNSIYEKLGAHVLDLNGSSGTHFGVWAPHAREVSVIGDFNGWNPWVNPLERRGRTGVWSGFVPAIGQGALYKFSMVAPDGGSRFDRADPYAFAAEPPPGTASKDLGPVTLRVGRRFVDGRPWRPPIDHRADHDLRGAPWLLDACSRGGKSAIDLS